MTQFKNPEKFPYEAFVEKKVEQYFKDNGYEVLDEIPFLDLHFKSKDGQEEWRIECKGETSSINVDFNTGIGQILKRMDDENSKYAITLPDTDNFRKQTDQIPSNVRKKLNLYWIWVNKEGEVEIKTP